MAVPKVAPRPGCLPRSQMLLDSPEIGRLIEELEETRWTGRPGYPIRTMVGLALAKCLYALPTWTKVVALVAEHWKLQRVLGCEGNPPSEWAAYRFAAKLRENGAAVERCIDCVVEGLKAKLPQLRPRPRHRRERHAGVCERPALRLQGQRGERNWHTDPDASWGHRSAVSTRRGGGFFGYRLHAAVCTATDLPVAWSVETAKANETRFVADLIDTASGAARWPRPPRWTRATTTAASTTECTERDCLPLIPLRQTPDVKRGDASAALLRARRLDVRGCGPQARRDQVALPDRRVHARVNVGCRPTACTR